MVSRSKSKVVLHLVVSIAFVGVALFLLAQSAHEPAYRALKMKAVGVLGSVFFLATAVLSVRTLMDNRPALVIDEEGIIDNSSAVGAGRVLWSEIEAIKVSEIQRQKLLTIIVTDPDKFIRRGSKVRQMLNAANSGLSGSPINISATTLGIGFDELESLLNDGLAEYRSKAALPG